jgi:hypothetical protein
MTGQVAMAPFSGSDLQKKLDELSSESTMCALWVAWTMDDGWGSGEIEEYHCCSIACFLTKLQLE